MDPITYPKFVCPLGIFDIRFTIATLWGLRDQGIDLMTPLAERLPAWESIERTLKVLYAGIRDSATAQGVDPFGWKDLAGYVDPAMLLPLSEDLAIALGKVSTQATVTLAETIKPLLQ